MTYLGIVFVILALIAPIVALLPSARQREQMALRKRAREAGLRTDITTINDPDPDSESYTSVTGKPLDQRLNCIAYRVPRARPANWRSLPPMTWSIERTATGWEWATPLPEASSRELREAVDSALEKLPIDAVRMDEERYVVSVYWHEKSGETGVEAVIDTLRAVASETAHAPREIDHDSEEPEG